MTTYTFRLASSLTAGLAIILVGLFFYAGPSQMYHAITQAHAHVGFNFARYNSVWLSSELTAIMQQHMRSREEFYDVADLRDYSLSQQPDQPFPINDTIGYGILLGLVWKITRSYALVDVQIIQIFLYLISLLFIYQIAFLLFRKKDIALFCTGAHLLFFPVIALAVQPVRDIWAYFATVLLLWITVRSIYAQMQLERLFLASSLFACMQYIRPTVFLALLTVSSMLIILGILRMHIWQKIIQCVSLLVLTNILFFWIPFITYNIYAYQRPLVGPIGQDLLEGLGEFENPWGYKLSDEFVARYIGDKYRVRYGTPEFDDKAHEEFKAAYTQKPAIYWRNIGRRLVQIFTPSLPWLFLKESPYKNCHDWQEKVCTMLSSWRLCIDFLVRHLFIKFFLLLGYIGMFIAWRDGFRSAVLLSLVIMIGGLGKLPSHIEYRYLVPFYWVTAFFVGYAVYKFANRYSSACLSSLSS